MMAERSSSAAAHKAENALQFAHNYAISNTSQKILNKARRILKHPGLDLLATPSQQKTSNLIIITPARVGTAVQRNTIRRQIKALFREAKIRQKTI